MFIRSVSSRACHISVSINIVDRHPPAEDVSDTDHAPILCVSPFRRSLSPPVLQGGHHQPVVEVVQVRAVLGHRAVLFYVTTAAVEMSGTNQRNPLRNKEQCS